jgi:hypothetical protein
VPDGAVIVVSYDLPVRPSRHEEVVMQRDADGRLVSMFKEGY